MVRVLMAIALVLFCEQVASAQVLNIEPPETKPGTLEVQGSIELPKGWTIVSPVVKVFVVRPAGGIHATIVEGSADAAGTAWNNGKTPAGAVVIGNLAKDTFAVFAMITVKDPKGKEHLLTSTHKYVNVP